MKQEWGEMVLSGIGCFCNSVAWNGISLSLSAHPKNEKLQILRVPLGMSTSRSDASIHSLVARKEVESSRCP